jgi:serine/threonine protein kinase/Tol biopolymer transport system component
MADGWPLHGLFACIIPAPMPPAPGTKLGHYEIVAPLGAGGMGVVYKARDTKLGRVVALKFPLQGALADETARTHLLREAQNASALNHPNIATIYEVGEVSGEVYISMEFVEGGPLKAMVPRDGMAVETAIRFGIQIAEALAHAHEHGIVHRDLKTANIVITADGQAKVLDFGLAKRFSAAELEEATRSQKSLTGAGAIVGTLPYMAPETLRGEGADARADVWALGVVLNEMVSGALPFHGQTEYALSSAILREPPAPLPQHVPPGLRAIIQRCLAKEPGQRYQRAAEARSALEAIGPGTATSAARPRARARRSWVYAGVGSGLLLLLLLGGLELLQMKKSAPPAPSQSDWAQLTDFADSAVSPSLSADGRILAFIRGGSTFVGEGQIEAKLLPSGEPVQLTHDSTPKMSPEFSPEGSSIAYTMVGANNFSWDTWVVPVLGGEPHLMMPNAEGLTWIGDKRLLFSEIKTGTGIHMAVVTANDSRSDSRDVYVPARARGMAHRSAVSPDHKWVLIAEMDNGGWLPCRLVSFDGRAAGRSVGPPGAACTYAAWSPDGTWMYFSSDAGGRFHIWRQRFRDGEPTQVTSGGTEEEGIAIAPDGSSLITSVGSRESTVWVRDAKGERQISSEGYADNPQFSRDGKKLYYLVRRNGVSGQFIDGELWVADIATGRSERLLSDTLVSGYDISPDGTEVVFSARDNEKNSNLWLASLDFRFPPRPFASPVAEDEPSWDATGHIYFRAADGGLNFLYRMKADGSERVKMLSDPILELYSVSPNGQWALAFKQGTGQDTSARTVANSLDGRASVSICPGYCLARWNPGAGSFSVFTIGMEVTQTFVVPVLPNESLPALPPAGLQTDADIRGIKGANVLEGVVYLGPKLGLSASLHEYVHRNLYRVPLR